LKYDEFKKMIHQASYDASIMSADGTTRVEKFENTNMFLLGTRETPEGVTVFGGKTGSTGDAGDCLVLYSEFEDGTGYISSVFKAAGKTSLYDQMTALLKMEK
ncbi:MAG: D-alanyl-D-alanine carboxypeptidase, partial [Clostridiales bacterium]|nr:D-alanyl-D-alanine carboxypeptidase [Clostridiales bacterium]